MSEKLYRFLLTLYPHTFRRAYGAEMLRLVGDRARSEHGFLPGLRLWLDLLRDLAISLPREYSHAPVAPIAPIVAIQPLSGEPSFQLLTELRLNRARLCLGGTLAALLFWACVFAVAHSGTFPSLFPAFPLQPPTPNVLAQGGYPDEMESRVPTPVRNLAAGEYSFCMIAQRDIPGSSAQPLLVLSFAPPAASGVARIDGRVVKRFQNKRWLSIRAHVFPGDHRFALQLDRPTRTTFVSSNVDFKDCPAK